MGEVKFFRISRGDNVAVALQPLKKGDVLTLPEGAVSVSEDVPANFKVALKEIKKGEKVIKYGWPIGEATKDISAGSVVHTHNIKSLLSGVSQYDVEIKHGEREVKPSGKTIDAFVRKDGKIGIRNAIFIIPTVGCVNDTCQRIADAAKAATGYDEIYAIKHPYGCSQLGGDQLYTQLILKGIALHPNAGGALIVSLGCENNNLTEFKKVLGDYDSERTRFIVTQESGDEIEEGARLVEELASICRQDKRQPVDISNLVIGLKCGGSDALSGITANPLVGAVADKLTSWGGTAIMTEVPEMFGAEKILMSRSRDDGIYKSIIDMVNGFKDYYIKHGESVSENPSPGNKEGGISTLEEKSLGCIQKGGGSVVNGVLKYGEAATDRGLVLLEGPGNDIVAQTALTAAGAHIILFTTGRGTPLGATVPTIKISTNSDLARRKPHWIDFNAGALLEGEDMDGLSDKLIDLIIRVASGEKTRNEINGYHDFAIWKNGVTL